jgi:hypothetical protein
MLNKKNIFFLIFVFIKGLCKKMLEAMTVAEHEGNVYCKQCYGRKFGFVFEKKNSEKK